MSFLKQVDELTLQLHRLQLNKEKNKEIGHEYLAAKDKIGPKRHV